MNTNWKYQKIGDVCTIERGGSPRPIDQYLTDDSKGINWIKIGDTTDSMYITSTKQKIRPEGIKKSRYVKPGDFLLSNSMSFGRPYILKIDGCIHDGWLVLRDEKDIFDKRFLYYYLSSEPTYQKFKSMAVGGVVNNLNSEMVRQVEVPIINKEEQIIIANLFDQVNELISLRNQQLEQLDLLIKSRFVEMFGDIITNSKYNKIPLSNLAKIGSSKRIFANEYTKEGIPFYRSKEIRELGEGLKPSIELYISNDRYEAIKKQFGIPKFGDILIAAIGATIGYTWRIDTVNPFYYKDGNLIWISLFDGINSIFLNFALTLLIKDYKNKGIASGSAQLALTIEKVGQMLIPNAPLELQNQFADFVEEVEKEKTTVKQSLEQLDILKKKLMQDYFG